MRAIVASATTRLQIPHWIPCQGGVDCKNWELPSKGAAKAFGVFGAHLNWPNVQRALNDNTGFGAPGLLRNAPFQCYTGFREPVSRVLSCWDFRKYKAFAGPMAALTLEKFRTDLKEGMSQYGFGCNNEPLRDLSNKGIYEEDINELTSGTPADPWRDAEGWALDAANTLEQTLEHLAEHCVVGVLERCEDTKTSLDFFFPWLASDFRCGSGEVHKNGFRGKKEVPTPAELAEIKRQNQLEIMAYDVANRLLDAQLEVVAAARNASRREYGADRSGGAADAPPRRASGRHLRGANEKTTPSATKHTSS